MPISTRHDGDRAGGNRFVPARFVVPVTTDDPVARMRVLGEISHRWRHEPAVGLASGLADVLELLPGQVTTSLFSSMLKGVDVVATNVPGLARPSTLGGAAITRMYGFAPPAGAAVNVALVTHADVCCIGVAVDTAAVEDPDQLVECLACRVHRGGGRRLEAVQGHDRREDDMMTTTTMAAHSATVPARLGTIVDVFERTCTASTAARPALRWRDGDDWQTMTWAEYG